MVEGAINTVVNYNKLHAFFQEHGFAVKADFQIVGPKPQHIIDN